MEAPCSTTTVIIAMTRPDIHILSSTNIHLLHQHCCYGKKKGNADVDVDKEIRNLDEWSIGRQVTSLVGQKGLADSSQVSQPTSKSNLAWIIQSDEGGSFYRSKYEINKILFHVPFFYGESIYWYSQRTTQHPYPGDGYNL